MLHHGVPWQAALGAAFTMFLIFAAVLLLSLVSGYFGWYSMVTAALLLIGFIIIVVMIPGLLNLSREWFWVVFVLLAIQIAITILAFAFHYKSSGLIGSDGVFRPSFYDALYFSVTTFTTLGYGDLQPIPGYRLTTSIEALFGMVSMAVGASLIWLWCQENLISPEMAFFDAKRRHKGSMSVSRIRIRTITGKEKTNKNWVLPPEQGDTFYYDLNRQEWLKVTKETEVPDNSLVMGYQTDEDA